MLPHTEYTLLNFLMEFQHNPSFFMPVQIAQLLVEEATLQSTGKGKCVKLKNQNAAKEKQQNPQIQLIQKGMNMVTGWRPFS